MLIDSKEPNRAYMIYLDTEILLSKKQYSDWREIQDEYYEHFVTSFEAMTSEEIIHFYESDFGIDDTKWPFSKKSILDFFNSKEIVIRSSDK